MFAILDGTKTKPIIVEINRLQYPNGFVKSRSLHWLMQEVEGLIQNNSIDKIVIKANEGQTANKAYEDRIEHEAAVILAGARLGIHAVFKKRKSTIAKDLGQKGRAKYLANLDTSNFPNFQGYKDKEKEAIYSAWSELK
jgi:hypothetical protein